MILTTNQREQLEVSFEYCFTFEEEKLKVNFLFLFELTTLTASECYIIGENASTKYEIALISAIFSKAWLLKRSDQANE